MNDERSCTNCGAALRGTRFCTECGAPATPAGEVERTAERTAVTPTAPTATSSVPPVPPPVPPPMSPPPPRRSQGRAQGRSSGWSQGRWLALGAVTVLVVGVLAFTVGMAVRHDPAPSARDAAATTPDPPAEPESSAPASPSGPPTSGPDVEAAHALADLLAASINDKTDIAGAASDLNGCRRISRAVRTFDDAAASRGSLADQVDDIGVAALDGGNRLAGELRAAWRAAEAADEAYASWGRSMKPGSAKSCRGDRQQLHRATRLSVESHPHKQAAAQQWNTIAKKYGLKRVGWRQL